MSLYWFNKSFADGTRTAEINSLIDSDPALMMLGSDAEIKRLIVGSRKTPKPLKLASTERTVALIDKVCRFK